MKSLGMLLGRMAAEDEARFCRDIPESQCHEQPRNMVSQITAQTFSKAGDALADSKVVLPWLLASLAAPAFMLALLVPIRESLSLLPQIIVGAAIRRFARRKLFWVVSSLVEGSCVILMATVAVSGLSGAAAGWAVIGLLVIFSIARGVASIAAKDVLGKTVSKGRRGSVSGYAAMCAGAVAVLVGAGLAVLGRSQSSEDWLPALLFGAGACWLLAAACFNATREHPGATEGGRTFISLFTEQWVMLLNDHQLQRFLLARALLVSMALLGPLYVVLAQQQLGQSLANLGWMMVAAGGAGASSSWLWGAWSDRSSRLTMAFAALLSAGVGFGVVICLNWYSEWTTHTVFFTVVVFAAGVAHAGFRIGRKTHIIDMAEGDQKASYVALSNTLIGVLLLVVGTGSALLVQQGLILAVGVLSAIAVAGGLLALTLEEAQ